MDLKKIVIALGPLVFGSSGGPPGQDESMHQKHMIPADSESHAGFDPTDPSGH